MNMQQPNQPTAQSQQLAAGTHKSYSQGRDGSHGRQMVQNGPSGYGAIFSEVIVEDEEEDNTHGKQKYQGMQISGGNSNSSSQPGPMQKIARMSNFDQQQQQYQNYHRDPSGSPPSHPKLGSKSQMNKKKNFAKLGAFQQQPKHPNPASYSQSQQQEGALMSAKENTSDTGAMFFNHATEENIYERFSPKNQNASQNFNYQQQANPMVSNKGASKKQNPIFKSQARNEQSEQTVFGGRTGGGMGGFAGMNKQMYGGDPNPAQKENDEYSYNIPSGGAFYSASHLPNMMAGAGANQQQNQTGSNPRKYEQMMD